MSRKNNINQIDLPDGSTKLPFPFIVFIWAMCGVQRRLAELFLIKLTFKLF